MCRTHFWAYLVKFHIQCSLCKDFARRTLCEFARWCFFDAFINVFLLGKSNGI